MKEVPCLSAMVDHQLNLSVDSGVPQDERLWLGETIFPKIEDSQRFLHIQNEQRRVGCCHLAAEVLREPLSVALDPVAVVVIRCALAGILGVELHGIL